ncbi:hypothetical protein ESY86_13560 [Subsaximicrobium wynnwilliamsii]|jgi:hypothetical protein|uniref:Uncharacterized protein n=1 Tax=Subsaximicrobium wynnwilliamsii TaxID=291179 RepID=A0A5C6ZFG6_9FLAO|nr:hypothetical protein [Subsaximicrobium wynnwilliamsii]TXD83213.1 hypothetical protein ESY87_10955 [Subsaximicrobium wynnwilliamsii]TXD88325.1 hypothetical protein ESY86_13560 [Subsaximicrobium wynnwilliamsii]TXE03046.1 hypothetical protein ESY88_09975 [Subsaximicrobium wynnwilliamsii]
MKFIAISISRYVEKHLINNPSENETDLRKRLDSAIDAYQNGVKCSCGNDIWVVGSASLGNNCFTCITGESQPNEDYEIDLAVKKRENTQGRKNIAEMDKTQIKGYFDDEGYEIRPELIKRPSLCLICVNNNNPKEQILCNMTRYDQKDENEFKCFEFIKK